jgi:hypothetical protein
VRVSTCRGSNKASGHFLEARPNGVAVRVCGSSIPPHLRWAWCSMDVGCVTWRDRVLVREPLAQRVHRFKRYTPKHVLQLHAESNACWRHRRLEYRGFAHQLRNLEFHFLHIPELGIEAAHCLVERPLCGNNGGLGGCISQL